MTRLLQISDMHFGTEQPRVVAALLALAHQKKPDVMVVSGDITQRATREQFNSAKTFCERMKVTHTISIPGNHDIPLYKLWARAMHPYAAYQSAFGANLEPQLLTDSVCIATVNTTRWWRHKNGQVSKTQIEQVSHQLSKATPRQLRVVVVHQPVHVLRLQDEHDRLRGYEAAVQAWSAAGADIVMGGHIHLPYVHELSKNGQNLPRRMWCVQAGTAVSSRVRREAPNSVNLLEFAFDAQGVRCSVEQWDCSANSDQFTLAKTTMLDLQRNQVFES